MTGLVQFELKKAAVWADAKSSADCMDSRSRAAATRCRCAYMRYVRSTFESTVGKNEKCAAVYNTAYGTQKQPCNSSARCLFSYIHSYPCASTLLLWIYEKQPHGCLQGCFFVGAVGRNLYEPVREEKADLSAVSISFSVFVTCSFVSFKCSGLSVKL